MASTLTSRIRDHAALERKWKGRWASVTPTTPTVNVTSPGNKRYILAMFPYPSGSLHMGHVRVYTISDTLARYHRAQGRAVLHPMGWDAFGLPAENASIERGVSPADWTKSNIVTMKRQLEGILPSFDWSREVTTCSPDYYVHTQTLFLRMMRAGLVYRAEASVNWDPIEQTVLANEQVDAQGKSWRSGALVEQKRLSQWFIRTTSMAEELLEGLDKLGDGWPEHVRQMQRQWIGKSIGADITFSLPGPANEKVTVFTSRPETIMGVSWIAVSPRHALVQEGSLPPATRTEVRAFVDRILSKPKARDQVSKEGMNTGLVATHPITKKDIPIFVAPYVLDDYGSGAVMGVAAHDARDMDFAKEHHLPILPVIIPKVSQIDMQIEAHTGGGTMTSSGQWDGMESKEAALAVIEELERLQVGTKSVKYRLRDWLVSRQRYWGAPIPIIHCPKCKIVPVPEEQLPVTLPTDVQISTRGGSPLAQMPDWVNVPCPSCHGPAKRETDTMDTFVDSSWYFLRYTDPHNPHEPFGKEAATAQMPVDVYVGGVEHAILHLLYARFFSKFLWADGAVGGDGGEFDRIAGEPFKRLLTQGMVHGRTYKCPETGQFLKPDEVDHTTTPETPRVKATGLPVVISSEKMSKSKYNGVDPEATVAKYGADITRLHILVKAPPSEVLEWDDVSIIGMQRWLAKVARLLERQGPIGVSSFPPAPPMSEMTPEERSLHHTTHETIQAVTQALEDSYQLHTAISHLIKLTNAISSGPEQQVNRLHPFALSALIRMLAPFAPAHAEEFWEYLMGHADGTPISQVTSARWPLLEAEALAVDEITCVVQVNGKMRGTLQIPLGTSPEAIQAAFMATAQGKKWIGGSEIKKVIVVREGRLANFICAK